MHLCQRYSSCFGRYFVFCLSVVCWNPYCSLMCHFTPVKITSDNSGGSKITGVTEYPQYVWNQVTNLTQLALLLITPLFPFLFSPVHSASQLLKKKIERERKEATPQGLEKQAQLGSAGVREDMCATLWVDLAMGLAQLVMSCTLAMLCSVPALQGKEPCLRARPASAGNSRNKRDGQQEWVCHGCPNGLMKHGNTDSLQFYRIGWAWKTGEWGKEKGCGWRRMEVFESHSPHRVHRWAISGAKNWISLWNSGFLPRSEQSRIN